MLICLLKVYFAKDKLYCLFSRLYTALQKQLLWLKAKFGLKERVEIVLVQSFCNFFF